MDLAFLSPPPQIFAALPASAFNKEAIRTGVGTTTSVWGGRADPAAGGAAAPFTSVLGSGLLGRWAGLHAAALGLQALPPRGRQDATVGAVGLSGWQV